MNPEPTKHFRSLPFLIITFIILFAFSVWYYLYQLPLQQYGDRDEEVFTATSTDEILDTSDWKTYRNEKYGFEFQYPKDSILKTSGIAIGGEDGDKDDTVGVFKNNGYFTICSLLHPCGTPDYGESKIVGYVTIDGKVYMTEGYQSEDDDNPITSMFIFFPEYTVHYGYRPQLGLQLTREEKAESIKLSFDILKSIHFTK